MRPVRHEARGGPKCWPATASSEQPLDRRAIDAEEPGDRRRAETSPLRATIVSRLIDGERNFFTPTSFWAHDRFASDAPGVGTSAKTPSMSKNDLPAARNRKVLRTQSALVSIGSKCEVTSQQSNVRFSPDRDH
jgi:hypothetical protein